MRGGRGEITDTADTSKHCKETQQGEQHRQSGGDGYAAELHRRAAPAIGFSFNPGNSSCYFL